MNSANPPERISHYRVLQKVGAGGMGEVYLAEDMKLGRKVALKLLGAEFTSNRDRVNRFEQEACAASALNHPNILTIHEVGVENGRHFIATEFIDGDTLRKYAAARSLKLADILDIAIQVASALEEAHGAGIVHRDIKPENIMIRKNGYVKVLDFGLAKLTEDRIDHTPSDAEASTRVMVQTDAGVVMGTSHYMSPEQTRSHQLDARSDIWSLGVVMYEMVAGRLPFEGETATDVIVAINQFEPLPLARFSHDVPPELEWIITKALRRDRDERYQTIRELLTDLRRLKQKLEFAAELERSIPPDRISTATTISNASAPATFTHQVAAKTTEPRLSSAEYLVSEIKKHKRGAGVIAAVFIGIVAVGAFLYFSRKAPAFTDRDTVVLADFVNTTGEPVFDGTLKQALAVQLGQSPFLTIFPEERVRESLRFMGRSPDERVTRDVAREICQRQGLKAMLVGSISALGSHYVVTLEAVNAQNGDAIAREQTEAESKEQVLSALGKSASRLREKLGESLSSIKKFDAPIEQATTSSLEALKALSQGDDLRRKGKTAESESMYKRAVEIDPNFALAYARLAVFYNNLFQTQLAEEYSQKAFDLRDRVSEHERFYISEKYHSYVTGDRDQAISVLKAWIQTYPNDYVPHNNLSVNYAFYGQYDEASKEAQDAVRLSPTNVTSQINLIDTFIKRDQLDEAKELVDQLIAKNPDVGGYHSDSFQIAYLRGDQATMKREADWARSRPPESELFEVQGGIAFKEGRWVKAVEFYNQSIQLSLSQGRKESAAQTAGYLAFAESIAGRCSEEKEMVRSALTSRDRITLPTLAVALELCNETTQAQSLVDELTKRFPRDTAVSIVLPMIKAITEMNRGNAAQAVQTLEPVRRFDLGIIAGYWLNYLRGAAFLKQRAGNEAAAEFQKILDHRGVEPFSPLYPLAHLGVARAAALSGDTARSRKEYQDFLALWKDADQNLPILIEAKKEYEQIK